MPNRRRPKSIHTDPSFLEMALVGYESAKESIEQKISEIKKMIAGGGRAISAAVETYTKPPKKRTLSARARRAMSLAQKKRWSDVKKAAAATVKTAKKKVKRAVKAAKAKVADALPS